LAGNNVIAKKEDAQVQKNPFCQELLQSAAALEITLLSPRTTATGKKGPEIDSREGQRDVRSAGFRETRVVK
jgi:hypothetical protein